MGEAEVPSGRRPQSTEPLFPTRGRLLHATTDWRFLCRPISSIQAVRQLSAGKSVGRSDSSSGLPRGGGTVENFESSGCARRARRLCGASHWGGDLRAGEKVRERAGVAGEARARRISRPGDHTGEHTGTRRRRYGRAGVHTEHALKQTRRQRFGVAGRKTSERERREREHARVGDARVRKKRERRKTRERERREREGAREARE